jgi:3-methylcrotonyl-CoA carboxylase alpha subunit
MEMNTRLQVEHPVTEAITGEDLVEWQLKVASGEALPRSQDELQIYGHSFEARLYAEDVPAGFLPATGTLTHLEFPEEARADSGVRAGDVISPFYDPMIAKLTVHGDTRAEALGKLARVLELTEVAGSVTNLAFLRALAVHEGFAAGDVDTGLIARGLESLVVEPVASDAVVALAALGALGLHGDVSEETGFTLWAPLEQTVRLVAGEVEHEVKVAALGGGRFTVLVDGEVHQVVRGVHWLVDGKTVAAHVVPLGVSVSVFAGHGFHFDVVDPLQADASHAGDGNLIEAPMPGLVKGVFAKAGQAVAEGDRLAILEAMKMEHALLAVRDGVVAEVLVVEGAQVEAGAALIRLEEAG